eukprot:11533015-Prorocentrum_lima.AAC.1
MTSSLVGSEMCIRDRPTPQRHPVKTQGNGHHCHVHTSTMWQGAGEEPVSYTHLTLPTICSV